MHFRILASAARRLFPPNGIAGLPQLLPACALGSLAGNCSQPNTLAFSADGQVWFLLALP